MILVGDNQQESYKNHISHTRIIYSYKNHILTYKNHIRNAWNKCFV